MDGQNLNCPWRDLACSNKTLRAYGVRLPNDLARVIPPKREAVYNMETDPVNSFASL